MLQRYDGDNVPNCIETVPLDETKGQVVDLDAGAGTTRAVERALDLLDLVVEQQRPLGTAELSRLTGIPKSTVHRLLVTLSARGYLARTPAEEKFVAGPRLQGGTPVLADTALQTLARPVMEGLRDTCGETVGLHLLSGDERVCISSAEGTRSLHTSGKVGGRAPLYSGASARVIMAHLPPQRQREIIERTGLAPLTRHTITDSAQLLCELERIRQVGYAVSSGEWGEGITSVAAPLFGSHGVTGSLNISGPSFRFSAEKVELLCSLVRSAADTITRRLKEVERT